MDLKSILNDAIAELNESNLPVLAAKNLPDLAAKNLPELAKMAKRGGERLELPELEMVTKSGGERLVNSDLPLAKLLGGAVAAGAGVGGVGAAVQQARDEQAAAAEEEAARLAAEAEATRLANRTPLEKVRDMGVEGYEKAKAALSGAYDDVAAQVQAHPYMSAAIPGALLAGAGALALRRRQMAAKNQ